MGYTKKTEQQTKTKRNAALYQDYLDGKSTVELVLKYQVSQTRIFQIIQNYKKRMKHAE